MILRKFHWTLLLSLHLLTTITAQNERSYDENDWIPITPSSDNTKKAQGRVLNLEAPSQNYFPENEYVGKRQPQQYLQENAFQKGTNVRHPKNDQPYKFEPVTQPQYQNQFVQQQIQPQFVQQVPYVPQQQQLSQQLVAPAQGTPNYYDSNKQQQLQAQHQQQLQQQQQQSYQSGNVGALNLELLGAIQNQNLNQAQLTTTTTKPNEDKETVQLLYVPLENLKASQPVTQQPLRVPKTEVPRRQQPIARLQHTKQDQLTNIEDDFIKQALAAHRLQEQFQLGDAVDLPTTTTPKPKKRKPNQPPLAVYMEKQGSADVKDVLEVLKNAKSISVQDSVGPDSPKVFVGPSTIDPEGYAKFPLPYLSSVQGNRIERKVENLPFFVAPLSYKTPDGYSKIPLPSPHVGSVVVSTKDQLHEKNPQDFDVKQPFGPAGDEPRPNPYLLGQNTPQTNLFGYGSDFLGLQNNSPQNYDTTPSRGFGDDYHDTKDDVGSENYEDTPSRDYNQNYQLDLKDNSNEYYDSPSYKPRERTRGNYRPYQSEEREDPRQNAKEVVPNYDIPSLPVESTPNYQIQQKPQISQFPSSLGTSFSTPKTPANVYSLVEEDIRQTTTTTTTEPAAVISQNQFKSEPQYTVPQYISRGTAPQDPLRQVINQFEIEQINSQLGKEQNVETVRSTTPAVVSTQKFRDYDTPTTARSRSRSRQRGRKTTTSTTPNAIDEENYTVLEEFALQPKTSTVKYTTEVETIPAKVYKIENESPLQVQSQTPQKQETLNQQILQSNLPSRTNVNYNQQLLSVGAPSPPAFNQQFLPAKTPDYNQFLSSNAPSKPTTNFNEQFLPANTPSRPATSFHDEYRAVKAQSRPTTSFNEDFVAAKAPSRPTVDFDEFLSAHTPSRPSASISEQAAPAKPQSRPTAEFTQQYIPTHAPSRPTTDFSQQYVPANPPSRPTTDFTHELLTGNLPTRQPVETERPATEDQDSRPVVTHRGQESQEQEEVPQINPYLPGLINNLQDHGVRSLLVPGLLVPTTEKLTTAAPRTTTEEVRVTTTTEAPRVETTTQRRGRGRQRAQTRHNTVSSTSAPRRTANRRRPAYTRPTTERQYSSTTEATVNYEPTRRTSSQRQRFRTRGRPVKEQTATERVSQTTENAFRQPPLEGGFQASSGDPQSYRQLEQVVDNQQVITIRPESSNEAPLKEYHQVYSLPAQISQTESVIEEIVTTPKPIVDVKVSHPATIRPQEPVIITTPSSDSRFIRVNSNIQSGGVYNNRNEEATRAPARGRVRSRTRGRVTSTTQRPRPTTTTTKTTTTQKPQSEEEEEFYGFIRQPNFNRPQAIVLTTQPPLPVYSSSYQQQTPKTLIQFDDDGVGDQTQEYQATTPAPVQFVGQIRPKYTTEAPEVSTEAPKVRSRARIRIPSRKTTTNQQQSYNEIKPQRYDDQVTRRSSVVRTRGRGKAHFKVPEKAKTDDQDVEGGNYPAPYLKNRELTTEKPSFQITVDPAEEELDDDQETHPSLYSPQVIRNGDTEWVEASIMPAPNDIEIEDKEMFVTSLEEQTTIPTERSEEAEEVTTVKSEDEDETPATTEAVETTTQKRRRKVGGRRRGVWKLIGHKKPVDTFETAESQNYFSVLNAFDNIEKKGGKDVEKTTVLSTTTTTTTTAAPVTSKRTRRPTTTTTTTTEGSIFETIYSMLGLASKASQLTGTKTKVAVHNEEVTTTTASPTFPEEFTEETTTEELKLEESRHEETTIIPEMTTLPPTAVTEDLGKDVEAWKLRDVKTSTSTEVSHETEICFKGKCVKSKDEETRL